jgi:xylulose-5-phosphate/fructose-6-phosphate phosphoketolase
VPLPDFRAHGVKAGETAEATRVLGGWLPDVMTANEPYRNESAIPEWTPP